MELHDLIEFAKRYSDLGTAVQEQVENLMDGDTEDLNHNAIRLAKDFLGGTHKDLDFLFDDFLGV